MSYQLDTLKSDDDKECLAQSINLHSSTKGVVLFTSPETLRHATFLSMILSKTSKGNLQSLCVDESHQLIEHGLTLHHSFSLMHSKLMKAHVILQQEK